MAKFIMIDRGNFLNPDRIAWVQDNSSEFATGTRIYFSGLDDDYMLSTLGPAELLALIERGEAA